MRTTAIIVVLGVSTVSLLGLCLVQRQQLEKLTVTCEMMNRKVTRADEAKPRRAVTAEQKRNDGAGHSALPAKRNEPEVSPQATTSDPKPAPGSPMSEIAKMMKNPGMKDMIRAQQKGQLDMMYGSLFKCLQLSDAELENFKSVLLDKQMALVESSVDMMSGSATPEEKKAAADNMKETTAAYDAQLKALLGDDNYTVFQSYEATQAERMQVTMFKGSLSAGDQMTDEQEDSLIRSMHEARAGFTFSVPELADQKAADPSMFTPERITKMLEESAKLQEQYVAKAAEILTPSQLELFRANQKQQQAMQEMGMNMAAKMFGQQASEKTKAK